MPERPDEFVAVDEFGREYRIFVSVVEVGGSKRFRYETEDGKLVVPDEGNTLKVQAGSQTVILRCK